MKGSIYTNQKCFLCVQSGEKGVLKYVEGRGFLSCPNHPEIQWAGPCLVRFGREHTKRFKATAEAERHLTFLRVQTDRGEFDQREWARENPLSFLSLREKFVKVKESQDIKSDQVYRIKKVLKKAGEFKSDYHNQVWDLLQIQQISDAEIDDFLSFDHRNIQRRRMSDGTIQMVDLGPISKKTLAGLRSVLNDFFKWVVRREKKRSKMDMPEIPEISYRMKMRTLVSIEDQQAILNELKRLTWDENPRIWLGIKLLSMYPKVRPGEMRDVKEGHINLSDGWIVFPQPKERDPKFIHLLSEHVEMINAVKKLAPPALPDVYFFRHLTTGRGRKPGKQFGDQYFNECWKRAAKNLGIESVPVYPGTKHSTTTALGQIMSPEQIKNNVTGHSSDAFYRYFLPDYNDAITATRKLAEMQDAAKAKTDKHLINLFGDMKKVK